MANFVTKWLNSRFKLFKDLGTVGPASERIHAEVVAAVPVKSDGTEIGTAASPLYTAPGTAVTTAVTIASGGVASGAVVDGAIVTLGAKADARSTATDTTAASEIAILKEISYMEQNPASRAVTNAGTFAVQNADTWRSVIEAEETANDSDKIFTVPASTEAIAMTVRVELTTTATVGNRQVTLLFTTGADVTIMAIHAGTTQAASLPRYYNFGIGLPDLLGFRNVNSLLTPLPALKLLAGYKLRVYDSAAVDAAADDMLVRIMWDRRAV